ncbi:MAG: VWA domain-containing protein [Oscillospiraceae bacterium]|nr:VWA domain-containing protein [Oscillospiraceae bacterium]
MKTSIRIISALLVSLMLVTGLSGCGTSSEANLTYDQAVEKLNAFTKNTVTAKTVSHKPDSSWVGSDPANELPSIDKYPLSVKGNGEIDLEIFSSTEKSDVKADRWLDVMAKEFNMKNSSISGKSVSVSIRPITSGLALNYITTRAYIPDAYTPANELWGLMIESAGIPLEMVEKRLTGNTAGILMKKDAYTSFTEKYGQVTVPSVVEAVLNGDTVLGHTNPNVSSTGLNIFTQELLAFDPNNPFSDTAISKFRQFQELVPAPSPTTDEMAKVAAKGILDSMIMESQAYGAQPTLSDWVFTPCGVRHDSPMYALDNLSQEKKEALMMFVEFCKTSEAQKSASSFGFNKYDDYAGVENKYTGAELFAALKLWKENKDAGRPVISVFIVDRSGSMAGTKLNRVKQALINSIGYINEGNYIGLVSYSSTNDITIDLPLEKFTSKQQALFAGAVKDFNATGETATNSALVIALDMLLKASKDVPNSKLRVMILSDGQQNAGLKLNQVTGIVNGLGVPVYGIGFEADLNDLQTLADINEAYCINADTEDVVYKIRDLFIAEM